MPFIYTTFKKLFPLVVLVLFILVNGSNSPAQSAKQISDGSMGKYEAFPDVVKLDNGELLACYYASDAHVAPNGRIIVIRSSDNGQNWSTPKVLFDQKGDDRDPSLFQTKKGTVLCNFMTFYDRKAVPAFRVRVLRSTDRGQTWGAPIEIESPFKKVTATSSPIIETKDGTLLLPVYGREAANGHAIDKDGQRDRAAILRSTDDGLTWKDAVFIEKNNSCHHQEPSLVALKDGSVLCMLRPNGSVYRSCDNGKSWTPVTFLDWKIDCPYLIQDDDGTILCGLRHRGQNPAITMMTSRDNGKNWSVPFFMASGYGAYPSIRKINTDTYIYIFYRDDPGPSRIWMLYFRLREKMESLPVKR